MLALPVIHMQGRCRWALMQQPDGAFGDFPTLMSGPAGSIVPPRALPPLRMHDATCPHRHPSVGIILLARIGSCSLARRRLHSLAEIH